MGLEKRKLDEAKRRKDDEFYTRMEYIEKELPHYDFNGKVVYCPCDRWDKSMFVKYFLQNFKKIGLKKLIATAFVAGKCGIYYSWDGVEEVHKELIFDGDFRSFECTMIKHEADCIVTNPPFSIFREFYAWAKDKEFLIVAPLTAIVYADCFDDIKNKRIKTGITLHKHNTAFDKPDGTTSEIGAVWFTNMDNGHVPPMLELHSMAWNMENNKRFATECRIRGIKPYQCLDGTDILEVQSYLGIPSDFDGIMAVPTSFIQHWNYDQFDVLGRIQAPTIDGKTLYERFLIKRK